MPEKSTTDAPSVPAGEQLAQQLNELLFDIRKSFGMHGGTNWSVKDVSVQVVTVSVFNWRKRNSPDFVAAQVSNTMLAFLRDMVPCPTFRAVFLAPVGEPSLLGGPVKEVTTVQRAFYSGGVVIAPGPVILIEENVEPFRRQWRPVIQETWGRLTGATS